MKRFLVSSVILCMAVSVALAGCGPKRAETSQEAIRNTETMKTPEQKTDYLLKQANLFLKEKDFKEVIDISQYVLWKIDGNSEEAKKIMRKAQDAMAVEAQKAAEELKKKFGK